MTLALTDNTLTVLQLLLILVGLGFAVVMVIVLVTLAYNWRAVRCRVRGHRWYRVEPYQHSTGVLTMTKRYRCRRCPAIPTIMDEQLIEAPR